jgi:O-acetyl-ADP-ribose deacetylase (regulator of RNase III)
VPKEQNSYQLLNPSKVLVNNKITVSIVKTDITLQATDVIVCPGNIDLEYASGIAGQVLIKGGLQIQQET